MGAPDRIKCSARIKEEGDRLRRFFVGGSAEEKPQVSGALQGWDGVNHRLHFPEEVLRYKDGFLRGEEVEAA
jgi:hypothetical protein